MKIVKASRGTIEQFSTALENKIAEIQRSDIDSSQVISSIEDKFYGPIDEEVEGCGEVMADTIPEDDPARERYLHNLIGDVQDQMDREGLPTNQTIFDTTDDALIITMSGDNLVEYEVPLADLKFDFDRIHEDVEYIMNAMLEDDAQYNDSIVTAAKSAGFQLSPTDKEDLDDIVDDQLYQAWDNYRGEGMSMQRICSIVFEHVHMILTEYPEDFSDTLAELAEQNKSALKKMVNEAVRSSYSDYDWD